MCTCAQYSCMAWLPVSTSWATDVSWLPQNVSCMKSATHVSTCFAKDYPFSWNGLSWNGLTFILRYPPRRYPLPHTHTCTHTHTPTHTHTHTLVHLAYSTLHTYVHSYWFFQENLLRLLHTYVHSYLADGRLPHSLAFSPLSQWLPLD